MATNLEWIVSLRDQLTGPAQRARDAIESVKRSVNGLIDSSRSAASAVQSTLGNAFSSVTAKARSFGDYIGSKIPASVKTAFGGAISSVSSRLGSLRGMFAPKKQELPPGAKYDSAGKLRDASGKFLNMGGGGILEKLGLGGISSGADSANKSIMGLAKSVSTLVTMKLAEWGYAAAKALLSVGAGAVSFAIESASFKRNMIASLELIEGTSEKAQETFTKINAIADTTPFETQKVMDMFKSLRSAGMGQDSAEKLFMALSDIASVQGAAKDEMLDRLKLAVIKIKGTGKLDMETLLQLSEAGSGAGINVESVLKAVAAKRGVSFEAARAALSSGQIKWEEAFQALQAATVATVNKGKELGTATKIFGTGSFEGALSTLKSKLDDIFSDIDIGPLIKGIQTLAGMLTFSVSPGEIVTPLKQAMLDLKGVVERTFNTIFKAFGELTTEDALTAIVLRAIPIIEVFGNAIAWAVTALVRLSGAFAQGFEQAYKFVGPLGDVERAGSSIGAILPMFVSIGRAIGGALGIIVSYASGLATAYGTVLNALGAGIVSLDKMISAEEKAGGGFGLLRDALIWFVNALGSMLAPVISFLIPVIGGIIVSIQRSISVFSMMLPYILGISKETGSANRAMSVWKATIDALTVAGQILGGAMVLVGAAIGGLIGIIGFLVAFLLEGIDSILIGLSIFGGQIAGIFSWIGEQIYGFVSTVFPEATKIGTAIVQGIWEGIKAAWGYVKSGVKSLIGDLPGISVISDQLGIQKQAASPTGQPIAPTSPFEAIAPTGATQGLGQRGVEQSNTFSLTMPIVVSASGDPASVASAVQQGATSAAPGVSQAFAALAAQFGAS